MADDHRVYRALVRLYPRQFRLDYGDDLVQHFDDLVTDRGARAAWARAGIDLTVTLPRYHLERFMSDQRSTIVLEIVVVLLALAGITTGVVGAPFSALLVLAAGVLAITQRSALATALRVPDTDRRHRRLRAAAFLGAVFAVSFVVFLGTVGDTWSITDSVLAIVGNVALVGAVVYLIAGLATPRTPDPGQLAGNA